jgi:hypothetical protein
LQLRLDGSGVVNAEVRLGEGFRGYLEEMGEEAKQLGFNVGDVIFDLDQLRRSTEAFPGVLLKDGEVVEPDLLRFTFSFDDLDAALPPDSSGHPQLFSYSRRGSRGTFTIHLDRESYAPIRSLIPGSENPLYDALGPQLEEPYTAEEYREVLAFMIGEEAPGWLDGSALALIVEVPGRVVSQKGGRRIPGGVEFEVPLLDVLLLREPLVYSVEFEAGQ